MMMIPFYRPHAPRPFKPQPFTFPAPSGMSPVHGRTVRQAKTTQGVANWDIIGKVKNAVSIPVVGNGGVETRADAERLLVATGADAVMSSEGLLEDPSLFDAELAPMDQLQGVEVRCLIWLRYGCFVNRHFWYAREWVLDTLF